MRVFVTGSAGQLGTCLVEQLRAGAGTLVGAVDLDEIDICKPDQVESLFEGLAGGPPDVLMNAAAYTQVDRCEDESELAMQVNGEAPRLLAQLCRDADVRMMHVSTDYVFDGQGDAPYPIDAPTRPQSVYGSTKLKGEQHVLSASPDFAVVRTSWVFGPGHNFVGTMLRLAREQRSGQPQRKMRVVDDQLGCPTYAADLAAGMLQLASGGHSGLFHLCNSEPTTWWSFARAILDESGFGDIEIEKGRSEELNQKARRPSYSVLDCSRAAGLGVSLRPWREALRDYLQSEHGSKARLGS